MSAMFVVLDKLTVLGLLIVCGYCLRKFNIMGDDFTQNIVNFLIRLVIPTMAIMSMQLEFSMELFIKGGAIFAITFLISIAGLIIGYPTLKIFKISEDKKGMWLYTCMLSNTVFMGLPVLQALYGDDVLFYCTILNLTCSLMTFTIGAWIIAKYSGGSSDVKIDAKKILFTPLNFAIVIGIIFFVCRIIIPSSIATAARSISSMLTPLGMIYIGMTLSSNTIREMISDWQVYAMCVIRLVIIPILSLFALKFIVDDAMMLGSIIIAGMAMPAPSMGALFVGQYGGDLQFASRLVFVSTLLSGFSIPLMCMLFV